MINQRDIVEIAFPEDIGGKHPAIVLSNKLVQEVEGYFVCVMITSKYYDDEFSFRITKNMVTKPMTKPHNEARCHLINFVPTDAILHNMHYNQLKLDAFKALIKKINETTFSVREL